MNIQLIPGSKGGIIMKSKKTTALLIILLLLLQMLPASVTSAASAWQPPSDTFCPYSTDGQHNWTDWIQIAAASCTQEGMEIRECFNCDYRQDRSIPMIAHSYGEWQTVQEPSCQHSGIRHRVCSVCGDIEREMIPETPHQYSSWSVVRAASCTEEGLRQSSCIYCGNIQTETIPKTDHVYGDWHVSKEATCTGEGTRQRSCQVCGNIQTEVLPVTPHNFGGWEVSVEATDHSSGIRRRVCQTCSYEETQNYDPEGTLRRGDSGSAVQEMQQLLIDQNFLEPGGADGSFGPGTEGAVISFQQKEGLTADGVCWPQTWEHLNHQFGEWVIIKEVTPFSAGEQERTCSKCGFTQRQEIYPEGILKRGDRGDEVKELQEALNSRGFNCGTPDGDFGGMTEAAVSAFESASDLPADGIAWPGVRQMLGLMESPETSIGGGSVSLRNLPVKTGRLMLLAGPVISREPSGLGEKITMQMTLINNGKEDLSIDLNALNGFGDLAGMDRFTGWPESNTILPAGEQADFEYAIQSYEHDFAIGKIQRIIQVYGTGGSGSLEKDSVYLVLPLQGEAFEGKLRLVYGNIERAGYGTEETIKVDMTVSDMGDSDLDIWIVPRDEQSTPIYTDGLENWPGSLNDSVFLTPGNEYSFRYVLKPTQDEIAAGKIVRIVDAEGIDPATDQGYVYEIILDIPLKNESGNPLLHMQGYLDPAHPDPGYVYKADEVVHLDADVSNRGSVPVKNVHIRCEMFGPDNVYMGEPALRYGTYLDLAPVEGMLDTLEYTITPEDVQAKEITFLFWAEGEMESEPGISVYSYNHWTYTIHTGEGSEGEGTVEPGTAEPGTAEPGTVEPASSEEQTVETQPAPGVTEEEIEAAQGGTSQEGTTGEEGDPQDLPSAGGEETSETQPASGEEFEEDDGGTLIVMKKEIGSSTLPEGYCLGEYVNYVITVTNTHKYAVKNVIVRDDFGGEEPLQLGIIASLEAGQTESFVFVYQIAEEDVINGYFDNKAYVRVETYTDENGVFRGGYTIFSNVVTVPVCDKKIIEDDQTLLPEYAFKIEKKEKSISVDPNGYHLNETVAYEIRVTNICKETINAIRIYDELVDYADPPEYLTSVWLAPGQSIAVPYSHIVTQQDIDKGSIENQAVGAIDAVKENGDIIEEKTYSDILTVLTAKEPPETTPEITPEVTPETTPEITPEVTPETTPEITPEVTPETTPEITPETTPETTPEITPEVTPETTPEITPEVTPEITPETTPEITPEVTPETTPEVTPEVTPETTPEITPEVTPETTPEITPETTSGQDHCRRILAARGEGVSEYQILYCTEHKALVDYVNAKMETAVSDEEKLQIWQEAELLLSQAVNAEYDELKAGLSQEEYKQKLEDARTRFFEQLEAFKKFAALYKDPVETAERTCTQLLNACVDLCYENSTAPGPRTDSILGENYIRLTGQAAPGEKSRIEILPEENSVKYREYLCEDHLKIENTLDQALASESYPDKAVCFDEAGAAWKADLTGTMDSYYAQADAQKQLLITEYVQAFDRSLAAKEALLSVLYQQNRLIISEVMASTVKGQVLLLE